MNSRPSITTQATVALSAFAILTALTPLAPAQTLPSLPIQFNPDTLVNPGRPGNRRRGGGSRGGCQAEIPLTALAYANSRTVAELGVQRTDEAVGTLTTQDQPSLWFYLPAPLNDNAELIVKDSREQVVYQGRLAGTTEQAGIVSVPMAVSLSPGAAYHWFLSLDCGEGDRTTVDGWLARQTSDPALQRAFTQADARNRAALYANYGFLQDALSELATLRLAKPDDEAIAQDWSSFLGELDLSELSSAPLLACCQLAGATEEPAEALEAEPEDRPESAEEEPEVPEPVESAPVQPSEPASAIERAREREGGSPRDR
jgi:hypothetical protein